jgi:adenosylhomocysteine nucleosidase
MPSERRIVIDGVSCFTGRHGGRAYWLVPTGIGPEAAEKAASAILNKSRAALAVSTGFAGALQPAVAIGDVIVATSVVSGRFDGAWTQIGAPLACHETVLRAVQTAATETGLAFRSGLVVSLTTVLCRAVEKASVSRLTGALALDMESAAIGNVAGAHRVPFAVVRTVSDAASEDLPLDFNMFFAPGGWMRGVGAMIMRPSSLIGLNRLRRQSRIASGRLTAVCAACVTDGFGLLPVSKAGRAL